MKFTEIPIGTVANRTTTEDGTTYRRIAMPDNERGKVYPQPQADAFLETMPWFEVISRGHTSIGYFDPALWGNVDDLVAVK